MSQADQPRNNKSKSRRKLPWRNLLIGLLAVSLYQYATEGQISWPVIAFDKISGTLRNYADRPEAGWRQAAEKLEEMGAVREGQPTPEFDLTGRVVRVADGDTLSLLDRNNRQHKIRLHGIDTPEREQAYGKAAWNALSDMVAGKTIGVVVLGKDTYGRTDATVYLDDNNINLAMVAGGHAWWYRYYAPHDQLLEKTEQQARDARLGLWAKPDPVPPWDWRRQQRYSRQDSGRR